MVSFLFPLIFFSLSQLSALNVWAYNWGKANIILKKHTFLPVSANAPSATQEYVSFPLNWVLIVFQSCIAFITICMKNASAVEMMIRIPVVMTGEIESWPCEELMYCSRANVWQEWGFFQASRTAPLILCNNWLKKRQSTVERGISGEHAGARFVYTIRDPGFSTNWLCPCQWGRGRGGEKAHTSEREKTVLLWLMSGFPPATQAHVCAK